MFFSSRNLIQAGISVYDGISPALLATISLSQNIKGSNHQELVNSLKSCNIVQSQNILSVLRKLDLSIFTKESNTHQNKPHKISKGQNMTDIFSHAVILNQIQPHLKHKRNANILDLGTGHGYLAFAVWMLAQEICTKPYVLAVDCYQECVSKCNQIKKQLLLTQTQLQFRKLDVNQIFQQNQKFDIILGGFFIEPKLSSKIQNILQDDGLGIWPQFSQSGQGLYVTRKNKPRQYLLQTLFSQQVVQSSVQEYFISNYSQISSSSELQAKKQTSEEQQRQILTRLKDQRNKKKLFLQQKLKEIIIKHRKIRNAPTLQLKQMQSIPQIQQVLDQLKKQK